MTAASPKEESADKPEKTTTEKPKKARGKKAQAEEPTFVRHPRRPEFRIEARSWPLSVSRTPIASGAQKLVGMLGSCVRRRAAQRPHPCSNEWPTPTRCRSTNCCSAAGAAGQAQVSTDSGPNKRNVERAKLICGRSEPNKQPESATHRPAEPDPDAPKLRRNGETASQRRSSSIGRGAS